MNRGQMEGRRTAVGILAFLFVAACSDTGANPLDPEMISDAEAQCSIPENLILNGGPGKDGIPALTNPSLVRVGDPGMDYLPHLRPHGSGRGGIRGFRAPVSQQPHHV